MAKAKKSTRKFNAKHLDRTIQQRRVLQKKRKRGQDAANKHNGTSPSQQAGREQRQSADGEDEADGEQLPAASRPQRGEDGADEEEDQDELDVDEFLTSGLLGGDEDDEDGAAAAPAEDQDDEAAEAEETAEEAEARLLAEIEEHEAEMKALAKSDPAFYKHLQDNDAELLQFNKADLLSQQTNNDDNAEDEQDEAVDGAAGQKKKTVKGRKAKSKRHTQTHTYIYPRTAMSGRGGC